MMCVTQFLEELKLSSKALRISTTIASLLIIRLSRLSVDRFHSRRHTSIFLDFNDGDLRLVSVYSFTILLFMQHDFAMALLWCKHFLDQTLSVHFG